MKQILFALLGVGSLFAANEDLERQLIQDYLLVVGEAFEENPVYIFNNFIYQQNEEGQWIQIGYKEGQEYHFNFETADRFQFLDYHPPRGLLFPFLLEFHQHSRILVVQGRRGPQCLVVLMESLLWFQAQLH